MIRTNSVSSGAAGPTPSALRTLCRALFVAGVLAALTAVGGCGRSQPAANEVQDTYQVTFATEPVQPLIGDGVVIITLKDAAGKPVDGARIAVEANMNHAGMVPVNAESGASQDGVYRIPLRWTMGGAWYVDARITLPDGEVIQRRFPTDVK
jgi:hypothetical protein